MSKVSPLMDAELILHRLVNLDEYIDSSLNFEFVKKAAILQVDAIIDVLNELESQESGKITGVYDQLRWETVRAIIALRK